MTKDYNKRMLVAIITGSILGIFCIIGIGFRLGLAGNEVFLASAWFNRLLMGIMIGASGQLVLSRRYNWLVRGAVLGFVVSFAWFLSTGFLDPLGFAAGIAYGIIIDYVATTLGRGKG